MDMLSAGIAGLLTVGIGFVAGVWLHQRAKPTLREDHRDDWFDPYKR